MVEPGTPEDVGKIVRSFPSTNPPSSSLPAELTFYDTQLNVIAAKRVPFAVRRRWCL